MLREAIKAGTDLGREAKKLMDEGILVSDQVVVGVVVERIKQKDCSSGFLFDGFPRTIPQAQALDDNGVDVDLVIEIDVPNEVIIGRMSGRRVHLGSGRNYHIEFNPSKVPDVDDLKDRLNVYRSQTLPLIDFYLERSQGQQLNYLKVSGLGSPSEVSELILGQIITH